MNVSELRARLQELEAQGHGKLLVVVETCECHDMDIDYADDYITRATVDVAASTYGPGILLAHPLREGDPVVRLDVK